MCVVPSIWIISIDETHRKSRFLELAARQESKLKEFMFLSYDLFGTNISNLTRNNNNNVIETLTRNFTHNENLANIDKKSGRISTNDNFFFIDNKSLANFIQNKQISSISDQISLALSLAEINNSLHSTTAPKKSLVSVMSSTLAPENSSNANSTDLIKKLDKTSIECCDVNVSYWFKEDQYQHLFFQLFMLVLITTRWLITSGSGLSATQRTFVLILSMANALDTLDLFSCLSLEMVFKNSQLVYSLLLIVSVSLVQFIFLPTVKSSSESSGDDGQSDFNSWNENCDETYYNEMHHNHFEGGAGTSYDGNMHIRGGINVFPLVKKKELKFKIKSPRLSLFNKGYDLAGDKKMTPENNFQPTMFTYGMNPSFQQQQPQSSYSYNKFDKVSKYSNFIFPIFHTTL